ncbi:Tol-Pal system beta propeller repeat protein TolB [Tropicimonas marinistellae]|uniref:Tol-Pal system beta propeller repeat protein TolB n=1 Tax=Tropicimonas marinistellae TaxID=1739787 RepID=UPI000831C9D5|nr:Tol-Pal system beta propeller repeat protein TolB [Tropicimonas marinistellae]
MFLRAISFVFACVIALHTAPGESVAQDGPLRIEITEGVIEPLPFALPAFLPENAAATQLAADISNVIAADLEGTGLFRQIPAQAHIGSVTSFDAPIAYADWKAINAQALITGAVSVDGSGRATVKFRLYDVFSGRELGEGLRLGGATNSWRRLAHKVADQVYSRITGEGGYFDSRVVFVAESGPKNAREKRLAVMDYDGANVQYLTDSSSIVLAPRFSPTGDRVLYTSYATGQPEIYVMRVGNVRQQALTDGEGAMTFAPRFGPDGETVVYSRTTGGNTDIFAKRIGGAPVQLTNTPSIETAPSYSPDGKQIVFESDRSGTQQLYIMSAAGGEARRISFGPGRYGTPVWSPRGDLIAFTKQNQGRFHIGVMRTDGSEERLLTASFLDEGPTWAPNGRVIMFTRESAGAGGQPALYTVDVSGRNLRRLPTPSAASDPAWSPLLP